LVKRPDEYVDMLKAGIIASCTRCIRKCCISCRKWFNHWMLWFTPKEENAGGGSMGRYARNDVKSKKTLYKRSVSFNNGTDFFCHTPTPTQPPK
jgi:hypothetical protein